MHFKISGCLRKQVVYFDSFHGFRLVDFNPFWFLFPIHKIGVPVSEGNWQVVNRLLKVVKRHLQCQNSTLICFNYIFLGTLLFNFQKFWGGWSPPPPLPHPPLRAWKILRVNIKCQTYWNTAAFQAVCIGNVVRGIMGSSRILIASRLPVGHACR